MATQTDAPPATGDTIASALASGIEANGLQRGGKMGVDLKGYEIGESAHVESLEAGTPAYDLVDVRVNKHTVAVAVISETPAGYEFSAIAPASKVEFGATGRANILHANGLTGNGKMVWRWAEGGSPFTPFIEGTDVSTGREAFVGPDGRFDSLPGLGLGR